MALQGKIIRRENGRLAIRCDSTDHSKPQLISHVWEMERWRTHGMSYAGENEAVGRDATIRDGRVSCYLGQGNWLYGELGNGGNTPAVSIDITDIPKPRTRVETRWQYGRWEKLTRKGWIAA